MTCWLTQSLEEEEPAFSKKLRFVWGDVEKSKILRAWYKHLAGCIEGGLFENEGC